MHGWHFSSCAQKWEKQIGQPRYREEPEYLQKFKKAALQT
jgi:hypothetical protein